MTAETIARALGGRKSGTDWMACCPVHDDREPSLSIRDADGKVLVCCHADCDQRDVIMALKDRGLWEARTPPLLRRPRRGPVAGDHRDQNQVARTASALAIWKSTIPANGTLVDPYLAARGLTIPLPPSLRFHRGLKHPSGGVWPCMIALVTRGSDGTPLAIHRTFLAHDGSGKAPVDPAKMMLGRCRGGAVRFGDAGTSLALAEGIETALSVYQTTDIPTWATLSTSGLRGVVLPSLVREIVICADGDDAGEKAANQAAERFLREGRLVRIARAPRGRDFNDVLMEKRHVG